VRPEGWKIKIPVGGNQVHFVKVQGVRFKVQGKTLDFLWVIPAQAIIQGLRFLQFF
jgi:hypothetical protein